MNHLHNNKSEQTTEHTDFSSLKRGDVILYRRDKSILVLHRIWKITNNSFYMVGDNQTEIEGPLRADQVRGKLTAFVHNGKFVNVKNPIYRFTSSLYHFFFCFFSTLLMFFSEISNAVFLFIRLTFQ